MNLTLSWSSGLLLKHRRGFMQLVVGRGCTFRRAIFWPQHGHAALRVLGGWWVSLGWKFAES